MDTSRKIICPIITVWVIFILNLFLNYIYLINIRPNIFDFHENYYYYLFRRYDENSRYSGYNGFIFFSFLINFSIELAASIFISLSFEKKKTTSLYNWTYYEFNFWSIYDNIENYFFDKEL